MNENKEVIELKLIGDIHHTEYDQLDWGNGYLISTSNLNQKSDIFNKTLSKECESD